MLFTSRDKLKYWMGSAVIILLPLAILVALGAVAVMGKTLYEVLAHSNDTPVETRNEVTLLAYRCAPLCECIGTLS